MTQNLNLDRLLEGDKRILPEGVRDYEIAKRFSELMKIRKDILGIFPRRVPCAFTREQIKNILINSELVVEGGNPALAVDELLNHRLFNGISTLYKFVELKDGNRNVYYQIKTVSYSE